MSKQVYIVAAKRTPFGAFGGKLKNMTATQLCTLSSKSALASGKVDPSLVDSVFVGNVAQTSMDAAYISRHVQLSCKIPIEVPALTINRLCGSGFQSVINGFQDILLGDSSISLCAGAENMSQSPLSVYGHDARFGIPLGNGMNLQDTLWSALTDHHIQTPMGMTAENLASKYNITRQECDTFALRSQMLWKEANLAGNFTAEMSPIELKIKGQVVVMETDEHPREVSLEKMGKLTSVFKKGGTVSAANASGICDGAGSILLASEEAIKEHNLVPMCRIVSYGIAGVDPSIMGIGPVPAIQQALKKANLTIEDMDRIEINEAFAAQFLVSYWNNMYLILCIINRLVKKNLDLIWILPIRMVKIESSNLY